MIILNSAAEMIAAYEAGKIDDAILATNLISYEGWPDNLDSLDAAAFDAAFEATRKESPLAAWKMIEARYPSSEESNCFDWIFGGKIHICETKDDLKEVEGIDLEWSDTHDGKWPNVTELAMSWDVAEYALNDAATGWAVFLRCSNNAGGPIYMIPKELWDVAKVSEHIKLTNGWYEAMATKKEVSDVNNT